MIEVECRACRGDGVIPAESELFCGVWGTRTCHACDGKGKVPAPPTWRKEPPTVAEVVVYNWWWNKPASGGAARMVHLNVEGCRYAEDGAVVDLGYLDPNVEGVTAVIVDDHGDGEFHLFDPARWSGEWCPAVPPP